jgi:peptidoglycan/xylan/chitin deacetylase (PgdA/CDA1 family)
MSRRRHIVNVRLFCLFLLFLALATPKLLGKPKPSSPPKASEPAIFSFGSRAILDSCWTPKELMGSPADKNIIKPFKDPQPDRPEKTSPDYFRPPLPPGLKNSIRSVTPRDDRKIVALTFDLCERANEKTGYDSAIVNYLRANNVKATFFAGGKWMRSHPVKAMQLMADPRFEVGNHAWTHGNLRVLKGQEMKDQVLFVQAQYELLRDQLGKSSCALSAGPMEMKKIPPVPLALRLPYGTCNPDTLEYLAGVGLPAVQWSIVSGDSSPRQTAQGIVRVIMAEVRPGAIIIMHANGRGHSTSQALPIFVPRLKEMGYEFVTVSELLASGPAFATPDCYELKPGDNLRYDKIFGKGW